MKTAPDGEWCSLPGAVLFGMDFIPYSAAFLRFSHPLIFRWGKRPRGTSGFCQLGEHDVILVTAGVENFGSGFRKCDIWDEVVSAGI